jgi:hypothetical protein
MRKFRVNHHGVSVDANVCIENFTFISGLEYSSSTYACNWIVQYNETKETMLLKEISKIE